MLAAFAVAAHLGFAPLIDVPVEVWGISPAVPAYKMKALERSKARAVVLIHGLRPQVLNPAKATLPEPHSWQKAKAELVKELEPDFDVFGVSYAQVGPVDWVAGSAGLREGIKALRFAGYKEIVLVGHSCGGIISRRFAELHPDSGVTKVVSVAAPHLGSGWAKLPQPLLPKTQHYFIHSLLPEVRVEKYKLEDTVPAHDVSIACVVCKLPRLNSDTTVGVDSQWPIDLQKRGVPATLVACNHFDAMKCEKGVAAIGDLVRGKIARWTPAEVERAQRVLFGPSGPGR